MATKITLTAWHIPDDFLCPYCLQVNIFGIGSNCAEPRGLLAGGARSLSAASGADQALIPQDHR